MLLLVFWGSLTVERRKKKKKKYIHVVIIVCLSPNSILFCMFIVVPCCIDTTFSKMDFKYYFWKELDLAS